MKKLTVLFCLLLVSAVPGLAHADERFEQGSWRLSVALDALDNRLSPGIGYFVADNLSIIGHFNVAALDATSNTSDGNRTAAEVSLGLQYFIPTNGRARPFFSAGATSRAEVIELNGVTTSDLESSGVTLGGGAAILVGDAASVNVGLELFFGTSTDNLANAEADVTGVDLFLSYALYF